ncbi:putative secreted protein [Pusillimonas sp. T7-7]|uniref:DUF2169 family type VI secretion system accessory protein n=1 Tax=Pusillimonas sp. (strain T7-7) TaxID=1007105 RepID=UPI0002084359|nr:DUF2169 domain-containing protein [Pusillimonas sp. T7-7]AEC20873.1 putative secreted protein [Pusillimonas sp. T7-7]
MHIYKPDDTMLMLGYASLAGKPMLTVTVGFACESDHARLKEQDAWKWLAPQFLDEPFDLGEKKVRGGFGVAGSACAPECQTVTGLTVRASVDKLESHLLVQGDRYWIRGLVGWSTSEPEPFERMPIGLGHAYGGPEWPYNPHGRGYFPDPDAGENQFLPNIEWPASPVLKPGDQPRTAALGAHPMASEHRLQWLGTLDDVWMEKRLPWLPDDTNARWFDRFDAAQCQDGYWRGDEAWRVENMHPQGEVRGKLPGLRPRLLMRTVADPGRYVELGMDLDTVWLFPNDERTVVLYRAQVEVSREDAKDIQGLAVFVETLSDEPRPLEYWSKQWQEYVDQEQLVPSVVPVMEPAQLDEVQALRKQYEVDAQALSDSIRQEIDKVEKEGEQEAGKALSALGLDLEKLKREAPAVPDEPGLPFNPPQDAAGFAAALRLHIDQTFSMAEEQARKEIKEKFGMSLDDLMAKARTQAEPDAETQILQLLSYLPEGHPDKQPAIDAFLAFNKEMEAMPDSLQAKFDQAKAESYAQAAAVPGMYGSPQGDLGEPPAGPRERLTREQVCMRLSGKESLGWTELDGLDLSGLDFSGADMTRAVLRECTFRNAVLSGARLFEAQIEKCDLDEAILVEAVCESSQIKACTFRHAHMERIDFNRVRMTECTLDYANLEASNWADAQVNECDFPGAVLKQARGKRCQFNNCRMMGMDASAANLESAVFHQCAMEGALFSKADMTGTTLQACQASRAQFDGANMPGLRTLLDTQLSDANMQGANLEDASLQDSCLLRANLREACLDRAFIKACDLTGTDAWRMQARAADFTDSRIVQASWRGANLMHASARQATLLDTDLTGSNLHAFQTRTATVQGLKLEQSLMTRCRLLQEYDHG